MTVYTVSPNTKPIYYVYIDWNNNGFVDPYCDISQYMKQIDITVGHQDELTVTANAGSCTITVNNTSKIFSHFNSSSTLYQKLIPGLAVTILAFAPSGNFQNAATNGTPTGMYQTTNWYNVWQGWTVDFDSDSGSGNGSTFEAKIVCEDTIGFLSNCFVTVPLLTNIDADSLIATIVNSAFLVPAGCICCKFNGTQPSNGDTMTLTTTSHSGAITHETISWKYVTTLSGGANEVKIGADYFGTIFATSCALIGSDRLTNNNVIYYANGQSGNIGAAGNGAGITYSTNFNRSNYWIEQDCWAENQSGTCYDGATACLISNGYMGLASRVCGNYFTGTITHTHSGAEWLSNNNVTLLDAPVTGLYPYSSYTNAQMNHNKGGSNAQENVYAGSISQNYRQLYPYVSDQNQVSKSTNAMDYIRSIAESEFGRVYISNNGQLNLAYWTDLELAFNQRSGIGISGSQTSLNIGTVPVAKVSSKKSKKINEAVINYTPRVVIGSIASPIVVGTFPSTIIAPGQSGSERWNGVVLIPGGGSVTVKINYKDPTSGNPMGCAQVITPLLAGTDWNSSDNQNANGTTIPYNYTNYTPNPLSFAVVNNGGYAEVTIHNTALGPLYIFGLQLRGVGIVNYQQNSVTYQSQTLGKQKFNHTRQMSLPVDPLFAYGVANWIVTKYNPFQANVYDKLNMPNQNYWGDLVNIAIIPWSVDLYQQLGFTDTQTGITTSNNFHVIGSQITIQKEGIPSFQFQLERLDNIRFFILDVSSLNGTDILGV